MSNDMRLNNDYRKSLSKDFRNHAEQENSILKEEYLQSIIDCDVAVANGFAIAKQVVERAFNPSDVTTSSVPAVASPGWMPCSICS